MFADYASVQFSEHIARSSSSIVAPFIALNSFLRSNALTWIELISTSRDLNPLIQTGKNLKAYLERRAKYRAPLGQEVSNVSAWASDLIHLVAQFGKALLTMPSSIQFLVPSVCPSGSVIFKTFKYYPRSLQLVGLSQTEWNDQISCIIYPKTQAYTLACSDNKFAVGLSDGSVRLYNETTCQEELNVAHGEPVRHLALANTNIHLAAAGRKKITMWDPFTGTLLWTATAPEILLAIEFNDIGTTLMTTTRSEYMIFWGVDNGEEEDRCQFEEVFEEVPSDRENKQRPAKLAANYRRPPNLTVFSAELNLLALGYRARPVGFWDLEDSSYVGQFRRNLDEFQPPVVALVFNPNLDLSLAAALTRMALC
jgi:WD40 repeat protein